MTRYQIANPATPPCMMHGGCFLFDDSLELGAWNLELYPASADE
jgi:hypothetical protein